MGHDRHVPAIGRSGLASRSDGRGESTRGIVMRAVADDHIQQHDGRLGICGLDKQALLPEPCVDHRVRPASCEFLFAEVDEGMALAPPCIGEAQRGIGAGVRADRPELRVS